jgi:hypothetical protein
MALGLLLADDEVAADRHAGEGVAAGAVGADGLQRVGRQGAVGRTHGARQVQPQRDAGQAGVGHVERAVAVAVAEHLARHGRAGQDLGEQVAAGRKAHRQEMPLQRLVATVAAAV